MGARRVIVAAVVWALGASAVAVFLIGGHVQNCLGPIGVTPESCRIALGLPPETELDRFLAGPGPLLIAILAGWIVIALVDRWRKRQRGGL